MAGDTNLNVYIRRMLADIFVEAADTVLIPRKMEDILKELLLDALHQIWPTSGSANPSSDAVEPAESGAKASQGADFFTELKNTLSKNLCDEQAAMAAEAHHKLGIKPSRTCTHEETATPDTDSEKVVGQMPRAIRLAADERIIAVVPEFCSGPGWANAVAWVYIVNSSGAFRQDCIQPDERTEALHALFAVGEAVNRALVAAVPVNKAKPA